MTGPRKVCLIGLATISAIAFLTAATQANTQDKAKGSSPPTIAAATLADITADEAQFTQSAIDDATVTYADNYGQSTTIAKNETDPATWTMSGTVTKVTTSASCVNVATADYPKAEGGMNAAQAISKAKSTTGRTVTTANMNIGK